MEGDELIPPTELAQLALALACPICKDVLDGPVAATCGHIFCSACIRGSLDHSQKQNQSQTCPSCRKPCTQNDLRRLDAVRMAAEALPAAVSTFKELKGLVEDAEQRASAAKQEVTQLRSELALVRSLAAAAVAASSTHAAAAVMAPATSFQPALHGGGVADSARHAVKVDGRQNLLASGGAAVPATGPGAGPGGSGRQSGVEANGSASADANAVAGGGLLGQPGSSAATGSGDGLLDGELEDEEQEEEAEGCLQAVVARTCRQLPGARGSAGRGSKRSWGDLDTCSGGGQRANPPHGSRVAVSGGDDADANVDNGDGGDEDDNDDDDDLDYSPGNSGDRSSGRPGRRPGRPPHNSGGGGQRGATHRSKRTRLGNKSPSSVPCGLNGLEEVSARTGPSHVDNPLEARAWAAAPVSACGSVSGSGSVAAHGSTAAAHADAQGAVPVDGLGECPLCSCRYPLAQLQAHVEICLARRAMAGVGRAPAAAPHPPLLLPLPPGGAEGQHRGRALPVAGVAPEARRPPPAAVATTATMQPQLRLPAARAAGVSPEMREAADIRIPPARNWHQMKDKEARRVMADCGLPSHGQKHEMAERYNRYRSFLQTERDKCTSMNMDQLLRAFIKRERQAEVDRRQAAVAPAWMLAQIRSAREQMKAQQQKQRERSTAAQHLVVPGSTDSTEVAGPGVATGPREPLQPQTGGADPTPAAASIAAHGLDHNPPGAAPLGLGPGGVHGASSLVAPGQPATATAAGAAAAATATPARKAASAIEAAAALQAAPEPMELEPGASAVSAQALDVIGNAVKAVRQAVDYAEAEAAAQPLLAQATRPLVPPNADVITIDDSDDSSDDAGQAASGQLGRCADEGWVRQAVEAALEPGQPSSLASPGNGPAAAPPREQVTDSVHGVHPFAQGRGPGFTTPGRLGVQTQGRVTVAELTEDRLAACGGGGGGVRCGLGDCAAAALVEGGVSDAGGGLAAAGGEGGGAAGGDVLRSESGASSDEEGPAGGPSSALRGGGAAGGAGGAAGTDANVTGQSPLLRCLTESTAYDLPCSAVNGVLTTPSQLAPSALKALQVEGISASGTPVGHGSRSSTGVAAGDGGSAGQCTAASPWVRHPVMGSGGGEGSVLRDGPLRAQPAAGAVVAPEGLTDISNGNGAAGPRPGSFSTPVVKASLFL